MKFFRGYSRKIFPALKTSVLAYISLDINDRLIGKFSYPTKYGGLGLLAMFCFLVM